MELSSYVAEIAGHQRKIVGADVRPVRIAHGDKGLPVRAGKSLPFKVTRAWNAPMGYYRESWYLVHPKSREVLFEGPEREIRIWGLQSYTEFSDTISESFRLEPGPYLLVLALDRTLGGEVEIEAIEVPAEEAA
jgi:hypothetical protein